MLLRRKLIEFSILFVIACVILIVLIALYSWHIHDDPVKSKNVLPVETPAGKKKLPCIICGSSLLRGDRLHTELYPGEEKSVVHIFGCPHCYGPRATVRRNCPICKKDLKKEGYLLGKMWKKGNGKYRVHVSGCTDCF